MPRDMEPPRLIFPPRAWLKWQYLCHCGPTEIGAFGLSREDDLLHVDDLIVLKQTATVASVAFDDTAVADLFDEMADAGIPANRFSRIWLHTHPGASVSPSGVDEETFRRVFGANDWAVMAILGRTGRTSARLRFNTGPGGAIEIATAVDWSTSPHSSAYDQTLFTASEAFVGRCTAKSTIYSAAICAGLMISQFTRWLRGLPVVADTQFYLLAMELSVTDS